MFGIFDYKVLSSQAFNDLQTQCRLSQDQYTIHKNTRYYFYYASHLYGFYELKHSREGYHYFKHYRYKPIYYYLPRHDDVAIKECLSDVKKILLIFKKSNQAKKTAFIEISLLENDLQIRWCCPYDTRLFGVIKKPFTQDMREACKAIEAIFLTKSEATYQISALQSEARFLHESLIDKSFSQMMDHVSDLYVNNQTSLPFDVLFNGNTYFFQKRCITHHPTNKPSPAVQRSRSRVKGFCLVMSEGIDEAMVEEFEGILRLFKFQKKIPFTLYRSLQKTSDLIDIFATSKWVHFIGHGKIIREQFHFQLSETNALSTDELFQKTISVPKGLVMSTCHSLHPSLRDWFFHHGGKAFIGAKGEVVSSESVNLYRSFYWQLNSKKSTFGEAFHSIQKKALKQDSINAFHLQLHGQAKCRFHRP